MKKFSIKLIMLVLTLAVVISGSMFLVACGSKTETVTITGSSSVSPLMQKLASEYEKNNKNIKIVITTSDSSTGISDTISGKNDIGMVSRNLKDNESGATPYKIADDGVVLIVNKNNTLDNATNDDIYNLYANGTAMGSVTGAISREEGSGTRDAFDSLIANTEGKKLTALSAFNKVVDIQNSTGYVMTEITSNATKVGYISLGSLNETVKALKYNNVIASSDNIKNGSYKLARAFNIVVKKDTTVSASAQKFIDFILSAKGQDIVKANGYISIL